MLCIYVSFTPTLRCISVHVVECRTYNCEIVGSNLGHGYCAPRSTQPSISLVSFTSCSLCKQVIAVTARCERSAPPYHICRLRIHETEMGIAPPAIDSKTSREGRGNYLTLQTYTYYQAATALSCFVFICPCEPECCLFTKPAK